MQDSPSSLAMDGYSSNVPAFLTKLWTLVEDPETNHLICWSAVSTANARGYLNCTGQLDKSKSKALDDIS